MVLSGSFSVKSRVAARKDRHLRHLAQGQVIKRQPHPRFRDDGTAQPGIAPAHRAARHIMGFQQFQPFIPPDAIRSIG